MCFKCYRSKNRNLVHDPHPFTAKYGDDEYEHGGDEGTASTTSECRYQRGPVASEAGDDVEDGDDGEVDENIDDSDESDDDEAERSDSDDLSS